MVDIKKFQRNHINALGQYVGPSWAKLFIGSDWPYDYGDYIPIDKRYSAAASFQWHWRAWFSQGREMRTHVRRLRQLNDL